MAIPAITSMQTPAKYRRVASHRQCLCMEAAAALIALTALSSVVCSAAPEPATATGCRWNDSCPPSHRRGLCPQYDCPLPGGGQIIVKVGAFGSDLLEASCYGSPRLPTTAELPKLPSAVIHRAKFEDCRAGSGGFAGVLHALGASVAAVSKLTLAKLNEVDGARLAEQLCGLPALQLLAVEGWRGARLPETLPALLRDLSVVGGGLDGPVLVLEARSLQLPALEVLVLRGVGLARLPAAALRPLAQLERLYLDSNRLTEVEPAALAGLRALKVVDLSYNPGLRLPPRLLAKLPALSFVYLRGCHITQLPANMFVGSHVLRMLYLRKNNLTALPARLLRDQTNLLLLDLGENRIKEFAAGFFSTLTQLRRLSLDSNNFTSFPGGMFSVMSGLFDVSLSHNRIRTLCEDWQRMPNLTYLDLSHNEFTELTDSDINFDSKLVGVDLRHNRIETVRLEETSRRTGVVWQPTMPRVLLDDNPLRCDCRLQELARRLNQLARHLHALTDTILPELGSPTCAAPPALARRPLRDVHLHELTCKLPAPECPAACICKLQMEELRLTCDAVPALAAWPALPYRLPDRRTGPAATFYTLRLTRAPADEPLSLPVRVRTLDLSWLGLRVVPRVSPPPDLLDLSGNELRAAAPRDNTTLLLLADNELACDCEHANDFAALKFHKDQVLDWELLQCAQSPEGSDDGPLRLADMGDMLCLPLQMPAWLAWLAGLAAAATVLMAVLVVAYWRWERELRILLGCCWWRPADDEEREFDVFVTYAHQDEAWVVEQLLPRLEGGARPLRLCLHLRDWEVGDLISRQIHRSVERSRRTLVVLSDHYLRSSWATLEFRAAYLAETRERRARVVVVVLRPPTPALLDPLPELKAYLRTGTCVQVGAPFFWSVLRRALPPGRERAPSHPRPRDTHGEALPLQDMSCVEVEDDDASREK